MCVEVTAQNCGNQAVGAGASARAGPALELEARAHSVRASHAAHLYELRRVMTTGMSAPPMEAVM